MTFLSEDEVLRRMYSAYDDLIDRDLILFELDANERSLTHKLAERIQAEFPEWHVDCEYNRDDHSPKRLDFHVSAMSTDDTDGRTVFPDIIVHHRNTDENFIVIEAKKNTSKYLGEDERKLEQYVKQLGYQYSFAVIFPVGEKSTDAKSRNDIVLKRFH